MATVFKRKKDKARRGTPWKITYKDANGKRRTVKGFTDKNATESLAQQLEAEARLRQMGVIDAKADRQKREEQRPLEAHLEDYYNALLAKGGTAKHACGTRAYIKTLISSTKAERISDLNVSSVQEAIAALKETRKVKDKVKKGASHRTSNAYLRAIKGFSRWLWRDGRSREDSLAPLQGFNASTDRRYQRRAFSEAELTRLIRAASDGPEVLGMSGEDRAMLYRLAVGTGFRAGELRSLTPKAFRLDDTPPTVQVAAAYSKRRRDDIQPIRPDLADALRIWLAGKEPDRPVFNMPEKTAKMLRHDLADAEIPYLDSQKRVADFHAFRHTYVSMLVRGGASVKVAQELARHSTPSLTIGRYAHAELEDQTAALMALPGLVGPGRIPEWVRSNPDLQ